MYFRRVHPIPEIIKSHSGWSFTYCYVNLRQEREEHRTFPSSAANSKEQDESDIGSLLKRSGHEQRFRRLFSVWKHNLHRDKGVLEMPVQ